jgi:hypothetical protein
MKPHSITTDFLRKHLKINSCALSTSGIRIDYCVDELCHEILIPPFQSTTVLTDCGFIEGRRPAREGENDLEVQLEMEGEENTRTVWVSWEAFATSFSLSQYWGLMVLIEHIQRESLKAAYWELMSVSAADKADLN